MTLQQITNQMNALEIEISRQQKYIALHGEANDKDSDKQWEQYKQDAEYNLCKWDALKAIRDRIKVAA